MKQELLEPLGSLSVLIVEDEEVALDALRMSLERRCRKVITAKSADEGLRSFKRENIDVVVADVNLESNTDGIDMAQNIRKFSPDVPIIFMTAYSDDEKIEKMVALNTISLIKKPLDLDEFFVLLLGITRNQLHRDDTVDLGCGVFYRRKDRSILKGYAVFNLTSRESDILELLIQSNGHPVPYDDFHKKIWHNMPMTMDSLRMHINSLRRKTYHELIRNHSRLGYKLQIANSNKTLEDVDINYLNQMKENK